MHISNIQIQNFRLFNELSLNLRPGLNVVVGENNSGKTALIDAIRLTLDTNSAEWTRIAETDFRGDETTFSIQLKLENISVNQAYVFVEHLTHEETGDESRRSVFYVNLVATLTENIRRGHRFILTEFRSGKNAEGPAIEREIRDYLSATYLKPLRDAEDELSAGRSSRLAQILASSEKLEKGSANFKNLLELFIEANKSAQENPGLVDNRNSIEEQFQNLTFERDKRQFSLAIEILGGNKYEDMSSSEKTRAFQDILERLSLNLQQDRAPQGLGYNNVLFMATELLLLQQEAGGFPLLLIEEPEAHLHPQLQMKFLKFIRESYSPDKNPVLQTILTTHSPNLASKAPLDSIIILSDGKAFPMRRGKTGLDGEDYVFLEKFLDVTKANLFFAKGVLIVEGDAENILLPTIAELLGQPLEDYGVSIVNVGNTAYARYAKIFLRDGEDAKENNWLPIKVACLRDLDLWPLMAEEGKSSKGFKRRIPPNSNGRGGNLRNWVDVTDSVEKTKGLSTIGGQNVLVCVSEEWTFEYCMIRSGLGPEIYTAQQKFQTDLDEEAQLKEDSKLKEGFGALLDDEEERAIEIYGLIENTSGAKTDVAYRLPQILKKNYGELGQKEAFKKKLPQYVLDALEHVTGPWPDDLDAPLETPVVEEMNSIDDEPSDD